MPLRRLLALAVLCLSPLGPAAWAQAVEYEIPTEYTLYPDRLAVTFTAGVDSTEARAALEALDAPVLQLDFRASSVYTVLPAPLTHTRRARLTAQPPVRDIYVQPLDLGRYLLVVELASGTEREAALALLADFDDTLQEPGWQPARHDAVVSVAPERQDALSTRLEAHPLVDYVSYVAQVEE